MTEFEKNQLVKQFEPLINKITKQFIDKGVGQWDDVKSMAYEGFVIALNTYNPDKSKMTFIQFAGFAIRNNILTGLNNELRTVKLSAYAQKKAIEHGEAVFNSVSFDACWSDDDGSHYRNGAKWKKEYEKLSQDATFADGCTFETLYTKLEDNFDLRDCEIFYRTFGLKDFDEEKGKDIAKYFGISRSLVSIKLKAVITYIKQDEELIEVLSNLLK